MSTRQTEFTGSKATAFGSKCRELSRFGHGSPGRGVARTGDREGVADLVFVLHLIQNRPPCLIFSEIRGISKDIHAMLSARQRDVDSIGALNNEFRDGQNLIPLDQGEDAYLQEAYRAMTFFE